MTIYVISGGFDPIHKGHVQMKRDALKSGDDDEVKEFWNDSLYVILNNDNWLIDKKGFYFMNEEQRKYIVQNINGVDKVLLTKHIPNGNDSSVCRELRIIKEIADEEDVVFCNGGDRKSGNIPEYALCKELGIKMMFNIGGGKIESSSELVERLLNQKVKK